MHIYIFQHGKIIVNGKLITFTNAQLQSTLSEIQTKI